MTLRRKDNFYVLSKQEIANFAEKVADITLSFVRQSNKIAPQYYYFSFLLLTDLNCQAII